MNGAIRVLPALGAGLVAVIAAQDLLGEQSARGIVIYVALGSLGIALYGAAAALVLRGRTPPGSLAVILVVAALMRVLPLAAPPILSTDLYRYIWDGRVQLAGINPYRYLPSAPELAPLRDPSISPYINRADYAPTIYPPVAQAIFLAIAAVWSHPFGVKAAMLGFEVLAVLVMLRLLGLAGLPRTRILLYAWQPAWPWEYAGNGHVDAAAMAFAGLALLAVARRRDGWAGAALAAAIMVKLLPAVLAPALWRGRGWRMPVVCAVAVAAGYAAYLSVGAKVFGFLGGYAAEEGLQSGGGILAVQLAREIFVLPNRAGEAWLLLAAGVLAVPAVRMLRSPALPDPAARLRRIAADALLLATVTTAALTPHYSWYFGWLAYLACLVPWRCVLWLTAACLLLYADANHDVPGWSSLIYAPFLLLAIRDARRPVPGLPPPVLPGPA